MELVGDILKKNRLKNKLNLQDISKELKISEDILSNLENSYFKNDIDIVYIIGHLRSYCSFLNLNESELINQFKKENLPKENIKIEIERPKVEKNFLFSNKVFSISLILIIFTTFYFLFIDIDKSINEYAIIPDLPENFISTVEKANIDNLDKVKKQTNVSKEENFVKLESDFNSSSAIASTSKDNDDKTLTITLKILDDTWIQLRDENDKIILSQLMNKNDEYSYDLESNYSITSGNAGHILVLINQNVRGKIGKKGQVVDSFIINKNFNN